MGENSLSGTNWQGFCRYRHDQAGRASGAGIEKGGVVFFRWQPVPIISYTF